MQMSAKLSTTLAPLGNDPRSGLQQLARLGLRHVQLSATQRETRPRELSQSARRDLLATMRRLELSCSGIDLWIPPDHFIEQAHQQRAVETALATIELALFFDHVPVSLRFPKINIAENAACESVIEKALHCDVPLADHGVELSGTLSGDPRTGVGIDPAAILSQGDDPAALILAHASRIASIRVCDLSETGMRLPLGSREGRLDVNGFKAAADVVDYERPIVIDARQWEQPLGGIEQTMHVMGGVA